MSVSREVIASVVGVDTDEVECQKCGYGDGGKVLVGCENPLYGHIVVASGSYCSLWMPKRSEDGYVDMFRLCNKVAQDIAERRNE